jgi:hypothetical protein
MTVLNGELSVVIERMGAELQKLKMASCGRCSDAGFENREQGRGCFFAWDGEVITHPEPERFFEVPIELPLPEDLNFIS